MITRYPTLYHKGKTGAMVQWTVWTKGDTIFAEHGQVGGKLQVTPGIVCTGKNIGKSNEATPEEQAVQEAKAMWVYKLERKYSETPDAAQEEVFLPMLAKPFKDPKKPGVYNKHAEFPVDVQPKLDGARALAYWEDGHVVLGTRGGKIWTAPKHINRELEKYMPQEMVLDGELYIHGVLFEDISSWTKKVHEETPGLEYHVYDMPLNALGGNEIWSQRYQNLLAFFKKNTTNMVVHVKVIGQAKNAQEALDWETKCLEDGYEGCMLRNRDAKYLFGGIHCNELQKVKSSIDEEFKIVGFDHGVGKFAKAVVWICVTKEGKEFRCNPKTTQEKREEMFRNAKKYIGQWEKIRFQNYTEEGKPRFPRGLGIRDQKDMS